MNCLNVGNQMMRVDGASAQKSRHIIITNLHYRTVTVLSRLLIIVDAMASVATGAAVRDGF